MTLTQVHGYARAAAAQDRRRLYDQALAGRLAQASQEDWTRFVREWQKP